MLIAQNDDSELLEWICNARDKGGDFVSSLARAALVADWENYPLLRPLLVQMRAKYRQYEPSDAVKAELKEHGRHDPAITATVERLMDERSAALGILLHVEHRMTEYFLEHPELETGNAGVARNFLAWLYVKDGAPERALRDDPLQGRGGGPLQ